MNKSDKYPLLVKCHQKSMNSFFSSVTFGCPDFEMVGPGKDNPKRTGLDECGLS